MQKWEGAVPKGWELPCTPYASARLNVTNHEGELARATSQPCWGPPLRVPRQRGVPLTAVESVPDLFSYDTGRGIPRCKTRKQSKISCFTAAVGAKKAPHIQRMSEAHHRCPCTTSLSAAKNRLGRRLNTAPTPSSNGSCGSAGVGWGGGWPITGRGPGGWGRDVGRLGAGAGGKDCGVVRRRSWSRREFRGCGGGLLDAFVGRDTEGRDKGGDVTCLAGRC